MAKKPQKKANNIIFIERFMVDLRDGAVWVLVYQSPDLEIMEIGRFNCYFQSSDKITKFIFDIKENERMWATIDENAALFLIEVHLRKKDDIEFFQKNKF